MKRILIPLAAVALLAGACSKKAETTEATNVETCAIDSDSVATVYFVRDITPENLVKIYQALGSDPTGKNVAVKISTGESEKSHQLAPALIAALIDTVHGTIVECNTAYAGNRRYTEDHLRTAAEHGYTAIANVDIMDADGDTTIAIPGGKHITTDIVGKHLANYDYMLTLSHFKGHAMGGFGGALKNLSIGVASSNGKAWIHSAGVTANADSIWGKTAEQDTFVEAMADAAHGVVSHFGPKNMAYINVANNLSVDCDCDGNPAAPEMGDLGIFASLDPVALDQACVDAVFQADSTSGNAALIERITSRHGGLILPAAQALGTGTTRYNLVVLE